jgi:hypothetical protein
VSDCTQYSSNWQRSMQKSLPPPEPRQRSVASRSTGRSIWHCCQCDRSVTLLLLPQSSAWVESPRHAKRSSCLLQQSFKAAPSKISSKLPQHRPGAPLESNLCVDRDTTLQRKLLIFILAVKRRFNVTGRRCADSPLRDCRAAAMWSPQSLTS